MKDDCNGTRIKMDEFVIFSTKDNSSVQIGKVTGFTNTQIIITHKSGIHRRKPVNVFVIPYASIKTKQDNT